MNYPRLAFPDVMNGKRAFANQRKDFLRPDKKRSFIGYGNGPHRRNIVSMSNEDLSNIMRELKQSLYHIGEALRLAEVATSDLRYIQPISQAQYLIQRFVRTTTAAPKRSNQYENQNGSQSNLGWTPMRSQFLGLTGFQRRGYRAFGRGRGNGRGHGRGKRSSFTQRPYAPNKMTKKPVVIKCELCDVKCNSMSQWEQHLNGHHHKARVAGEETPKRSKRIEGGRKGKDPQEKPNRKISKLCPIDLGEVEEKQHTEGRKQNKKTVQVERRNSNEKRPSASCLRCELCDTTCNGKVQYEGHMNGKQHQMAVERREKVMTVKTGEKITPKEAWDKDVPIKNVDEDVSVQTGSEINM